MDIDIADLLTVTFRLMFSKSSSRIFDTSRLSGGITSSRLRLTASSSCFWMVERMTSRTLATSGSVLTKAPGSTVTIIDSELTNISLMFSFIVVLGPEVLLVVDVLEEAVELHGVPVTDGFDRRQAGRELHVVDDPDAARALALHHRLEDGRAELVELRRHRDDVVAVHRRAAGVIDLLDQVAAVGEDLDIDVGFGDLRLAQARSASDSPGRHCRPRRSLTISTSFCRTDCSCCGVSASSMSMNTSAAPTSPLAIGFSVRYLTNLKTAFFCSSRRMIGTFGST